MEAVGWAWPLLTALAASGAALLGSALVLALGERAERAAVWLLSYAIGTLLAAAMLHLLPEAIDLGPPRRAMALFLGGIVAFIAFERLSRWRKPHAPHPPAREHPALERATAAMILWGDALHNLADGLVLGAAFAAGRETGVVAALAVFAHEVPQEIGDFGILLGAGYPRRRALLLNWLSALATVPGAALAFGWASASREVAAWLLPVSAGILTHIALADLVPAVHGRRGGAGADGPGPGGRAHHRGLGRGARPLTARAGAPARQRRAAAAGPTPGLRRCRGRRTPARAAGGDRAGSRPGSPGTTARRRSSSGRG